MNTALINPPTMWNLSASEYSLWKKDYWDEYDIPTIELESAQPYTLSRDTLSNTQIIVTKSAPSREWLRSNIFLKSVDELSTRTREVLGSHAVKRFKEFKRYPEGWDHGHGKALSSQSVAMLETFTNFLTKPFQTEPSLFFTRDGNLQLGWEDKTGLPIEIEFYPDRIDYYRESTGEEYTISPSDATTFEKFVEQTTK